MKLVANKTAYSNVVGGGLMLKDEKGRAVFQIVVMGTTNGINKEQDAQISQRITDLINEHGLEFNR